jgi:hypothetical protein
MDANDRPLQVAPEEHELSDLVDAKHEVCLSTCPV